MMKDIRINGKMNRVFVLKETEDRIIHIPVKSLHRVDYGRLRDIESKTPAKADMLDAMRKTELDNGRNALVQYDLHIQVYQKKVKNDLSKNSSEPEDQLTTEAADQTEQPEEKPKPKRRGRPPKNAN
jgi:hypothetical protein